MKNKFLILLSFFFTNYSHSQTQLTQYGSDVSVFSATNGTASTVQSVISGDGNTVAVSRQLYPNGTGVGVVKIFNYNSGIWNQSGSDIMGETAGEEFGSKLAISEDGLTVAIGAWKKTTELGWGAGYVRVYNLVSGNWVQKGQTIYGFNVNGEFGKDILLSGNGDTMIVKGQTTISQIQYLKVFNFSSGIWNLNNTIEPVPGVTAFYQDSSIIDLSSDGTRLAIKASIWDLISNQWIRTDNNFYTSNIIVRRVRLSGDGNTLIISNDYSFFVYKNYGENNWQYSYGENISPYYLKVVDTNFDGTVISVNSGGFTKVYQLTGNTWNYFGFVPEINSASLSSNGLKLQGINYIFTAPSNYQSVVKVYDTSSLLGLEEFGSLNFTVFPNPAKNIVSVHFDDDTQLEKLSLFNLHGLRVMESTINSLDISSFSKGCYFLEVITNKGKAVKRVIFE